MAEEQGSGLVEFGKKIIAVYYPEFGYECCFLPRVFKANYTGPVGAASGAFAEPQQQQKAIEQSELPSLNHAGSTKIVQQTTENGGRSDYEVSKISQIEEEHLPSTISKNRCEPKCTVELLDQHCENRKKTWVNQDHKASTATEQEERKNQQRKAKKLEKEEKFKKKREQLTAEILTESVMKAIKGDDGEQKVFSMCQERLQEGFVIQGFKYNSNKHKTVMEMDPEMAALIEEEFAKDSHRNEQKNKSQMSSGSTTIPELEVDFLIFHQTKGLCIGEVKAGNEVRKAKEQLKKIERLMKAVARRCQAENLHIDKAVLLPFDKEDPKNRQHRDKEGFVFIREDSNWWQEMSAIHSNNVNPDILYSLIGLYADFVPKTVKGTDAIRNDQQKIKSLEDQADLTTVIDKLGKTLDQHEFLKSNYCRSHVLNIGLRQEIGFRLNDAQSEIFHYPSLKMFIEGSPGTGKSLVLKYKAFELAARDEKVGLVVPDRLYRKYKAEMELYGEQLTRNLLLVNFSELKVPEDLSVIFDGTRHAFIDEAISLILLLKGDVISMIRADNTYFWATGDYGQFTAESNVDDKNLNQIHQTFSILPQLTTALRSTREITKHLSSLFDKEITCGNRLYGPPVQICAQGTFVARSRFEFLQFCKDRIERFLRPLRPSDMSEEIGIIVSSSGQWLLEKLLEEDGWLISNRGLNIGYYNADQVASMEWNTVISVETSPTSFTSNKEALKYVTRSRARVNLLILLDAQWRFSEDFEKPRFTKQVEDLIFATAAKARKLSRHSYIIPFHLNRDRKKYLLTELMKFYASEWPVVNEKMRQLFPTDGQELPNLPWSLPAIADLHIWKLFELAQLQYDEVGHLIVAGRVKTAIDYSNKSDFAIYWTNGLDCVNNNWKLDTRYGPESITDQCNRILSDNSGNSDQSQSSSTTTAVAEAIGDVRVSEKDAQKFLEEMRDALSKLEHDHRQLLNLQIDYCDQMLDGFIQSLETTTAAAGAKELVAFLRERLERSEFWQKLVESCQSDSARDALEESSLKILSEIIRIQLHCAGSLLSYNPLQIVDHPPVQLVYYFYDGKRHRPMMEHIRHPIKEVFI